MLLLQSFLELPFFGCLAIAHGNNWTIFGDQDMDKKTCSKSPKLEIRPRHTKVTEEVGPVVWWSVTGPNISLLNTLRG